MIYPCKKCGAFWFHRADCEFTIVKQVEAALLGQPFNIAMVREEQRSDEPEMGKEVG